MKTGWVEVGARGIKWDGTLYAESFEGDGSALTGISAGVSSVFGRTGAVVAASNDYTWAQINKGTSDIAYITTKSHTSLSDIGTNTHAQIDTHISDSSDPHGATLTQTNLSSTNINNSNWASFANVEINGVITLNGSAGSSGQLLTSSGAGVDPVWTTVASSTSYLKLISTQTVSGGAVTSIDFTSLSPTGSGAYLAVVELKNATGSDSHVSVYINNDTTATNYYTQRGNFVGSGVSAARANDPRMAILNASGRTAGYYNIFVAGDSTPMATNIVTSHAASGNECYVNGMHKTATVSSITRITFTGSVASSFDNGSRISLYEILPS